MAPPADPTALIKQLSEPPPPGHPYGVPLPGTEREGRSPIYRHWRQGDEPLMTTIDPTVKSMHDMFEKAAQKYPTVRCMGQRAWNPATRSWEDKYSWLTFAEVAERRKNFGAGLVEVNREAGTDKDKYGVGLWAQNRTEWHITGKRLSAPRSPPPGSSTGTEANESPPLARSRRGLAVPLHRIPL